MLRLDRAAAPRVRVGAALLLTVLCGVGCGGCSTTYVLRAAYEESRILWSREPIEERLESTEVTPEERGRLELLLEARQFAEEDLGLDVGGAYGSVADVPPGALLWVVSASDRFALRPYTWWFPIVGDVTYKGFFHEEEARAEAARLEDDGYDTYVRTSAAFSTLGWFDDPILSTWLDAGAVPLVRLLFHELLHRTTYLTGETTFNESFATFAGNAGAIAFFAVRDGPDTERAREHWEKQQRRSARWGEGLDRLRALYRAGAEGQRSEAEMLEERTQIFAEFGDETKINNAVLLAHYAYLAHLRSFACVLERQGGDVREALAWVRERSEASPEDPFGALGDCAPSERSES